MSWLSDEALERLRAAAVMPDFSGTRYLLQKPLGRGGMGTVFLAEDTTLGRNVAVKVLDLPDASGELAARMLREARIVAGLEHPGIVPVHDAGTLPDGRVFYAMKYVQGDRLDQHLPKVPSLADRLRLFLKVCDAVAFAHAHRVLHRDLKPENIMVGPFGEVLVMDWGVAKVLGGIAESCKQQPSAEHASVMSRSRAPETGHGTVLGTPGYMAPEQARGEIDRLDERSDVFGLGAILRFLLTGRGLLEATTAGAEIAVPRVPPALAAICAKAMSPEPADRYAGTQEMAADIARHLDGLPVSAYPENILQKAGRLLARHRVAVILILAYITVRLLLLFLLKR